MLYIQLVLLRKIRQTVTLLYEKVQFSAKLSQLHGNYALHSKQSTKFRIRSDITVSKDFLVQLNNHNPVNLTRWNAIIFC